jgi:adenosylcobinamide-phosphate synthase
MLDIVAAVILDFFIGDPESFPHPVKLMGKMILLEEKLARKLAKLKIAGLFIVVFNMLIAFFVPFFILNSLKEYKLAYHIVNVYLIYSCIAARCLHDEAMRVYNAIDKSLEEGRKRLSYIVGRDTENLSTEEVVRADVETVAENTSDGVIAPLLYVMIFGAPGGLCYKFINTMDSMLGYINEKYIDLGFFPAQNDDLFNFIPSRLTGVFMCLSSIFRFDVKNGFKIMLRDRNNHRSPNCAYPEGAVAGLLNVQLGGDNYYFGKVVHKPKIGDSIRELEKDDIKRTIEIMYRAEILLLLIYVLILAIFF